MEKISHLNELDKALITGIYGPVEIKKEERRQYLGELAERIILALTSEEMAQRGLDIRFKECIKNPVVSHVVISGRVYHLPWAEQYRKAAAKEKIPCRIINDSQHEGSIALIIVEKQ